MIVNKNKWNEYLSLSFLILGLLTSQFYLWSSGLPQISHIIISLAILNTIFFKKRIYTNDLSVFFLFLLYIFIVNIIWFFINDFSYSYITSIIYWIFNFLLFSTILNIFKTNLNKISFFYEGFLKVILTSYVIEIVIWLSGIGRYSFFPRYNGLFNDPNQMAFWILSTCSIYIYLSKKKYNTIFVYSLALFLIMLTMSRSALIGFMFLTTGLVFKQKGSILRKTALVFIFLLIIILIFSMLYKYGIFDEVILRFLQGVQEKDEQAEGRGFDIIKRYPEYLVFGAGQGKYELYSPVGNEIHSTWLGMLFYYGVFGLSLFLIFLYKVFKRLTFADKLLFLGPMFYGFTTYSARTIIFWYFLAIFILGSKYIHERK